MIWQQYSAVEYDLKRWGICQAIVERTELYNYRGRAIATRWWLYLPSKTSNRFVVVGTFKTREKAMRTARAAVRLS